MTLARTLPKTAAAILCVLTLTLTGCHHKTKVVYQPPPPAPPPTRTYTARRTTPAPAPPAPSIDTHTQASSAPPGFFDDTSGKPVLTETGLASWYGTVYHQRAAADGTTFDQNAMTAAHRTLPMGTTVRVTNLETGQQVLVRITDRGPFAGNRILDLSMGAAKAVGLYRMGVAKVKIEAYAHHSTNASGKWCVQTGSFKDQSDAIALKNKLLRRYHDAKVIEFPGPTGFWVRIDPPLHTKTQATEIAGWIGEPKPSALPYVVRLD